MFKHLRKPIYGYLGFFMWCMAGYFGLELFLHTRAAPGLPFPWMDAVGMMCSIVGVCLCLYLGRKSKKEE